MAAINIDRELIERFEQGLDLRHPERSQIPARVLGYGEISTVLEIGQDDLAYKRMPMFKDAGEATRYEALYDDYLAALAQAGIEVVPGAYIALPERHGRVVAYIVQEKLRAGSFAHKAIHALAPAEIQRLFQAVLIETGKVFNFNRRQASQAALGFDAQISNWAIADYAPGSERLPDPIRLRYFDTSTPLMRLQGAEQLDPELFLRSAPSFLVWIIRLFLLEDVMTRYYDLRQVTTDIIANFYKEGRPDLIPGLVDAANSSLLAAEQDVSPLTTAEIDAYYREDARIWRIYLAFRKIDRSLHRLLGKEYPYVLPDKIKR